MTDLATSSFLSATLIHRARNKMQGLDCGWSDNGQSSNIYCPGETEELHENFQEVSLLSAQFEMRVKQVSAVLACHKTHF